jgi:hypothetical protein
MTIIESRLAELQAGVLDKGSHSSFEEGACAMEWISYLAGEGITDAPECASPVLRTFTISLNDRWDDAPRQRLVPYLPRMVGTAGDGQDEARSYLALDWLIRTYTPAWLDLAGLTAEATALRDLRRIVDLVAAEEAGPVVRAGRDRATAAGTAARAAAGAAAGAAAWTAAGAAAWAARAAAWDAAWTAAGAAAGTAAGAAAGAAAWDAAWTAAGAAAWTAAGAAAWTAAGAAAGAAAWDAAWDAARAAARAAAGAAARAALRPTMETLQASALDLLDRMIDPSAVTS